MFPSVLQIESGIALFEQDTSRIELRGKQKALGR